MKTKNLTQSEIEKLVSYGIGKHIFYYSEIQYLISNSEGNKMQYFIYLKSGKEFHTFDKKIYDEIQEGKNNYEFYKLQNVKSDFEDKVKDLSNKVVEEKIENNFNKIFEEIKTEYLNLFKNTTDESQLLLDGLKQNYIAIFDNVSVKSTNLIEELTTVTNNKIMNLDDIVTEMKKEINKASSLSSEYSLYLKRIDKSIAGLTSFLHDTDWGKINQDIKDKIRDIEPITINLNSVTKELEKLIKL